MPYTAWPNEASVGLMPTAGPEDVIELPLLVPEWQLEALEEAARRKNMTVGQFVRRLFNDMFAHARPSRN